MQCLLVDMPGREKARVRSSEDIDSLLIHPIPTALFPNLAILSSGGFRLLQRQRNAETC